MSENNLPQSDNRIDQTKTSFIKKHFQSIIHNTIGGLFAHYIVNGGPVMIATLSGYSAYLNDLPAWKIIIIVLVTFILASYLWNSIRRARAQTKTTSELRSQDSQSAQPPAVDTEKLKANITKLEGEKTPLEAEKARAIEQYKTKVEYSQPSDRTELEIRFDFRAFPSYRIGIYNAGTNVARGVEVWVERVWGRFDYPIEEHLPHRLRTRDSKENRYDINPGREELFEFVRSSLGEPDKGIRFDIDGIQIIPTRKVRTPAEFLWLRQGEHLHFWIRVCCGNADDQTAVFFLQQLESTITLSRIC